LSDTHDAIVVGAGPAGLAAAALLAERGASTLLLDEQPTPGGQIYRGVEALAAGDPVRFAALGPDFAHGLGLVHRLRASGADYRPDTSVWQITRDKEIWCSNGGRSQCARTPIVLIATGAIERPVPLPGWTLPGVMTVGSLQILLKSAAVKPNGRLVLIGAGPLLLLLAKQYFDAGIRPAAILETARRRHRVAALRHMPRALGAVGRSYLAKGMALTSALRNSGVAVFREVEDVAIEGTGRAEAVVFSSRGTSHRIAADLVGLHEGVVPSQQMPRSIRCAFTWNEAQFSFRPVVDEWGRSSIDGVFIAGDGAGIGGAVAAEHAGRIAALEALRQLGKIDQRQRDDAAQPERHAQTAHLAIRPLLDALYPPPPQVLDPDDAVVVCRCEEVEAGALRAAVAQGCQGPNQAKSFLRCGMGPCQGRLCGPTVSQIIARARGCSMAEVGYFGIRPPVKPVTVGEFAQTGANA
jgi:NADPH-dependent 2,4-dienoyl-CoA reductase/sulfur reductase-like enzyme